MDNTAHVICQKSIIGLACSITLSVVFLSISGCGSGGDGESTVSTTSTTSGATATLAWNPVEPQAGEPSILGYYIYYGRQSTGQPGSCSYEDSIFVTTSSATVTGLRTGSRYHFAVSAYNGIEGPCSDEILTDT